MSWRSTGLRAWVWQRLSALYLLLFLLVAMGYLALASPEDHVAWRAAVGHPAAAVLIAGFVLALLIHAWVGMRDVIIDYVHPLWARLTMLGALGLGLIATGLWGMFILLSTVRL